MTLPATLLKVRFADRVDSSGIGRMQDNIGALLDEVAAVPILGAVHIKGVDLTNAASLPTAYMATISHGLNRAWVGWLVTDRDAAETVYRVSNDFPGQFLVLAATGAVTVDVMVW